MSPAARRISHLLVVTALTACVGRQAPAPVATARLRIIGTNDFHGAMEPRRIGGAQRGGAAALAATIERAES